MERSIKAEIRNEMKQLQGYVDMNIAQIVNRVEVLEGKVEALQKQQERSDYDPEVTVVARGLIDPNRTSYRDVATDQEL